MEADKAEMLRQRQLAFVGKQLAGFSFGMEGHLATIRKSADCLGDCLQQAAGATVEERDRFAQILSTIQKQIKILVTKSQHLFRFAQRMDTALSTFDPGELVEEVLAFSSRLARVREVTLRPEVAEILPSLYNDPMRIHFLVLVLMNDMLERVGSGGEVILRATPAENGVLIEVEGQGIKETGARSPEGEHSHWLIGQQVVAGLGGRLETTGIGSDRKRSSLFLPTTLQPGPS
jgi:signal transduction histidine kinase